MKQPEISRLFILVCIAVLLGAYGVGLGVRKARFAGIETQDSAAAETEKAADKPESDNEQVVADAEASSEPSQEWAEEAYEEAAKEFARPERSGGGGAQMVVVGPERIRALREQLRKMNVEEAERIELQAARAKTDEENYRLVQQMWPNLDEETRGKISAIIERWPNMSEEERDYYRAGNIE